MQIKESLSLSLSFLKVSRGTLSFCSPSPCYLLQQIGWMFDPSFCDNLNPVSRDDNATVYL